MSKIFTFERYVLPILITQNLDEKINHDLLKITIGKELYIDKTIKLNDSINVTKKTLNRKLSKSIDNHIQNELHNTYQNDNHEMFDHILNLKYHKLNIYNSQKLNCTIYNYKSKIDYPLRPFYENNHSDLEIYKLCKGDINEYIFCYYDLSDLIIDSYVNNKKKFYDSILNFSQKIKHYSRTKELIKKLSEKNIDANISKQILDDYNTNIVKEYKYFLENNYIDIIKYIENVYKVIN